MGEEVVLGKEAIVGDEEVGVEGGFGRIKVAVAVESSHGRMQPKVVPE